MTIYYLFKSEHFDRMLYLLLHNYYLNFELRLRFVKQKEVFRILCKKLCSKCVTNFRQSTTSTDDPS
jgi:hypothetical protein